MQKKQIDPKLKQLQHIMETDLEALCKNVLGMTDWDPVLHNDLAKFLNTSGSRKLILMPRGHLKSSIITVGWVVQQVLRDPNIRVLITNAVWDKARDLLHQISGYLTDKSVLPAIYGQFQTPQTRWTRDEIEIKQRTKATQKEPTIMSAGIERSLTGYHFDLAIFDDLVDSSNITTREQVEKVKTFYRNALPLMDPGSRIVVLGTRWIVGDLYEELITTQATSINGHKLLNPQERMEWRKYIPV